MPWRDFNVLVAVENALDDFFDFVGQAMVRRKNTVEIVSRFRRPGALCGRDLGSKILKALADARDTIGIILRHVMRYAAGDGMQTRAAQRFGVDDLSSGSFDEIR